MECFSHDMGPVVRMARPENPNEIDKYVNPFCTDTLYVAMSILSTLTKCSGYDTDQLD